MIISYMSLVLTGGILFVFGWFFIAADKRYFLGHLTQDAILFRCHIACFMSGHLYACFFCLLTELGLLFRRCFGSGVERLVVCARSARNRAVNVDNGCGGEIGGGKLAVVEGRLFTAVDAIHIVVDALVTRL